MSHEHRSAAEATQPPKSQVSQSAATMRITPPDITRC